MDINAERYNKINRIIEEYGKRYTQKEVADKLGMSLSDVRKVTMEENYRHTRKITQDNRRPGEKINLVTPLSYYHFLDKYPDDENEE